MYHPLHLQPRIVHQVTSHHASIPAEDSRTTLPLNRTLFILFRSSFPFPVLSKRISSHHHHPFRPYNKIHNPISHIYHRTSSHQPSNIAPHCKCHSSTQFHTTPHYTSSPPQTSTIHNTSHIDSTLLSVSLLCYGCPLSSSCTLSSMFPRAFVKSTTLPSLIVHAITFVARSFRPYTTQLSVAPPSSGAHHILESNPPSHTASFHPIPRAILNTPLYSNLSAITLIGCLICIFSLMLLCSDLEGEMCC